MSNSKRMAIVAVLGTVAIQFLSAPAPAEPTRSATPFIHVTDLYRPHMDPDDHWDLACVYSLAHRGDIALLGILIDYPPAGRRTHSPDIAAVAQMNRMTGMAVPVTVGSPHAMRSRNDSQPYATATDHQGVQMLLDILRASDRPVVITITGSCRDVAVAANRAPDLFAKKCARVYVNAGTGLADSGQPAKFEYNVTLDKTAYAAIFTLPCPVFWMPCFEGTESDGGPIVRAYASHYRFRQSEILPHLADPVRNYFACMFGRSRDPNWLGDLEGTPDGTLLAEHGARDRHMWCTAGLLDAVGHTVTPAGKEMGRDKAPDTRVFQFEPIQVACSKDGVTQWHRDPTSTTRFIFHVRDVEHYAPAVTSAMKALLATLAR
jgi:hypothetical protein